ncbi:hypothetical protein BDO18943_03185 [Burkholderia dolosa]|nr:hypothetical protein BDO18943_03185 [Burkholderia dolosa]
MNRVHPACRQRDRQSTRCARDRLQCRDIRRSARRADLGRIAARYPLIGRIVAERTARGTGRGILRSDVLVIDVLRIDRHRLVRDDRAASAADRDRRIHDRRLRYRATIARRIFVPRIHRHDVVGLILVQCPTSVIDRRAAVASATDGAVLLRVADLNRLAGRDSAVVVLDRADVRHRDTAAGHKLRLLRRTRHLVLLDCRRRIAPNFDTLIPVMSIATRRIFGIRYVIDVRIVCVPVIDSDRSVAVIRQRVVVDRLLLAIDIEYQHAIGSVRARRFRYDL